MKDSKIFDLRRISLSRRSIIKAGVGGAFASIWPFARTSAQSSQSSSNAQAAGTTAQALAIEEADRTLAAQGTGAIAIVTDGNSSVFGGYLAEILTAEGVRDYSVWPLSQLSAAIQSGPRVILLAPAAPNALEIAELELYVSAGGGLVALRPAAGLDVILGVSSEAGMVNEGYVRVTDSQIGGGLYSETMQFHGSSRRYAINGATQIAELYTNRTTSAGRPAATLAQHVAGRAAMFSYDLAHSVVLTRQGNPTNADQDVDGDGYVRINDLYKDWIDLERSHVPQADIQQRLLVRLIDAVTGYPSPRLWYFPGTAPTVLVPTGDAHANPDSYFQAMVNAFSQRGMGMTFYLSPTSPSAQVVAQWISQGFDFSIHPYVDSGYATGYSENLDTFASRYGFSPNTARTHMVRWTGWSEAAEIESQFGMEMDFNSYQWGTWVGTKRGYMNGSGSPMRFVTPSGTILSIYQQHTNLVDEQLAPEVGLAGISLSQALAVSHQTIDEAVDQFHSAIATQYHVDYFAWGGVNPWVLGTTDYALQRGAAPLTAAQWLEFVKARAATTISDVTWASNTLSFSISGGGSNRTVLLPIDHLGAALIGLTRNGSSVSYTVITVDGRSMAAFPAVSGSYEASYAADSTPPVISDVAASPTSETATITWTTDEPATSVVDYGLDPGFGSQASAPGLTTSHSVTLNDLTPATTYYYRVTSADASENSSSSSIQTFTTAPPDAPSISGISPSSGQAGTAQAVTISGANFVAGATAQLGTTVLQDLVVVSSTTIQATVPASIPVGQHDLTVTNPDGQSAQLPGAYLATAPPPTLTGVTPPVVTAGQEITLSGTGFVAGASILIGTTSAEQPVVHSSTSATATVPLSLAADTYSVTILNSDGQAATLTDALTVSALPSVTHTTVADFAPGTFDGTAVASGGQAGDGAIVLASQGWLDTFDQSSLDPGLWTSGLWQADGSISLSSGILTVSGAWVRSLPVISSGLVTGRLTFTASSWLNFGMSRTDDLDTPWFLFGVPGWDTSQVYVRYNFNGGSANIPLPGLLGTPHDYTIVIVPGLVRFLVDGEEVHQVSTPGLPQLAVWIGSFATGSGLAADSVEAVSYAAAGTYLSPALDAGSLASWHQLLVSAQIQTGTSITARARSSVNGAQWSAWSPDMTNFPANLSAPDGRYLQYQLNLAGTDGSATPIVGSVGGSYQVADGQEVGSVNVTPESVVLDPGATQQFTAQVFDTNGDPLPDAEVNWSVVNGGGTIDQNGLFTAGSVAGDHPDTVVASSGGITGTASVSVVAAPAPEIAGISPSVAVAGDTVALSGQNFGLGAQVHVGTTPGQSVTVLDAQNLTFIVPSMADGAYDVVVTNPDGQSATLVNGLTISSLNWISQTTLADFQGGAFSGTEALSGDGAGDGAVGLLNSGFADPFDGSALDPSRWSTGLADPSGEVSVGGGQLIVRGAWVRSQDTMTNGTLAARLTFSSTAWQNFGLSRTDDLDVPWFLFGVPGWDTTQVYVRYNFDGGVVNIPLPGLLNLAHDYAIVREPGLVRFVVDGQEVHQVAIPSVAGLAAWLSAWSLEGAGTTADSIGILNYVAAGEFLSSALDAGQHADWLRLVVDSDLPSGTSAGFRARSSTDAASWSGWSTTTNNSPADLTLPAGRYLQYELSLATSDTGRTPLVTAASAAYLPAEQPTAGSVIVSPSSAVLAPGATQQFSAQVLDGSGQVMPDASVTWDVVNGGGTIDQNGLFTAGSVPGDYPGTVVATSDGVSGSASITVEQEPPPAITFVDPSSAVPGDAVTISGANFQAGATLALDSTPVSSVAVDTATIAFTVPSLPPGTYDVTVTNPDGQSATLVGGLTIQEPSAPVQIIHTSAADFATGTNSNTQITTLSGGEIRLLAAMLDEFSGSQLSADWLSGTYGSSGSAVVSDGQASVTNAWIQSSSVMGQTSVTARLTFSPNGSPFLNFGFGAPGSIDSPWFLFGIPGFDTSTIYARTNVPGAFYSEHPIGGLALNVSHEFTIRRQPDRVVYEVDGAVVTTHLVDDPATTSPLALWISAYNTGQTLVADWVRVEEYPASGAYTSGVIDAGAQASWSQVAADVSLPNGTSAAISMRSSADGSTWSNWSSSTPLTGAPQAVTIPNGRYLQYMLTLSGNGTSSPEMRSVAFEGAAI